jgi:hypothetical protein
MCGGPDRRPGRADLRSPGSPDHRGSTGPQDGATLAPVRHSRALPISLALIVAILAAGCGGGGGISSGMSDAGSSAPTVRTTTTTGRRTPTDRQGPPAAPCGDARFAFRKVFPSTAAAGTEYTSFVITNLSGQTCTVSGYPRIVALGLDGRPVGGPALTSAFLPHTGRKGPRTVTIARNGTASFMVESSDNDPLSRVNGCRPRAVSGDRILLPGSRRAETMPSVVGKVCSGTAGVAVGPIEVDPSRE